MNNNYQVPHAFVLGVWLLFCAFVVYVMVVVGGITRLTQSGLSMVEWDPIMGIVPPIGEAAWMEVFDKYRQSPEYLKVNMGMSLDGFKTIFYWEYGHRVLGRVIGLIYFIPLLFFLLRGMVPRHWYARLFGLFVLGGLQGVMGWYMVKSGLVDVPQVSQYRLTAHLGLAIVILACMFWFALDFLRGEHRVSRASSAYLRSTALVVLVVFIMMLSGGFVAGTKAGFIINTFPTMHGKWVPDGLFAVTPGWKNLFENPVMIQFLHRLLAVIVTCFVLVSFWLSSKQSFRTCNSLVVVVLFIQIILGISALVLRVPVLLGAAHQAGAATLLLTALFVAHRARKVST